MPTLRITRTTVEKLEGAPGKQIKYFDSKTTGFGVIVNGESMTYFVRCRIKDRKNARGKQLEIYESIGRVGVVPYEKALEKAKALLENAANGIAPDDIRRQNEDLEAGKVESKKKEAKKDITVQSMLDEYVLTRKKLKASTRELYQEDFDRYIPDWKDMPLRSINGSMIIEKHSEIGAKSKARADGVMRVMRALFNHAMAMHDDIIIKNPVKKLSAVNAWYNVARRETYIRPGDLAKWVPAVMNLGYDTSQDILLLLLFNGSRLTESATLKWKDVNLTAGTVAFRETKTGIVLEVPLSKFMIKRLNNRMGFYYNGPDSYVFPSYGKSGHIVSLAASLKSAEATTGVRSSHHDLRRTFISYCEELDINTFTRKRLANHAIPLDVTEGYTQFNIEKLRVDIEKVAAFILGHAGIPYEVEQAPSSDDHIKMLVNSELWKGLNSEQRTDLINVLTPDTKKEPQVITSENVIDLEAVKTRRRLCLKAA